MKKEYVAPALDLIKFDINDIISHSNATSNGETVVDPWGDRTQRANFVDGDWFNID